MVNPEVQNNWAYSQSTMILNELIKKMFEMNLKGIESAMKI